MLPDWTLMMCISSRLLGSRAGAPYFNGPVIASLSIYDVELQSDGNASDYNYHWVFHISALSLAR